LGGRRFPVYYRMMRSLRSVGWIPLFVALLGTATAGFSQAIPTGWTIYPTPEEGSAELHCASFSRTVWRVSASEAGMLQIDSGAPPTGRLELPLPHGIRRKKGMVGRQTRLKIPSGWLLGFDGGEFGGGLWFAARTGNTQLLSGEQVLGFTTTPEGVLAVVGVGGQATDVGQVLIVHDSGDSQVTVKTRVVLDGAPEAITPFSEHSVLVVTTHGISQVSSDGTVKRLSKRSFGFLYPNSVVVTKDGEIYVGGECSLLGLYRSLESIRSSGWYVRVATASSVPNLTVSAGRSSVA